MKGKSKSSISVSPKVRSNIESTKLASVWATLLNGFQLIIILPKLDRVQHFMPDICLSKCASKFRSMQMPAPISDTMLTPTTVLELLLRSEQGRSGCQTKDELVDNSQDVFFLTILPEWF